jgi:hypothetical protein
MKILFLSVIFYTLLCISTQIELMSHTYSISTNHEEYSIYLTISFKKENSGPPTCKIRERTFSLVTNNSFYDRNYYYFIFSGLKFTTQYSYECEVDGIKMYF